MSFEQIVEWASVFTGENRTGKEYYHVTEPVKRLEWSLTHVKRQLIALIGLQGTGKSSALNYLARALWKTPKKEGESADNIIIKWNEHWDKDLAMCNNPLMKLTEQYVKNAIQEEFEAYHESLRKHPFLKRIPHDSDFEDEGVNEAYRKAGFTAEFIIGKGKVKEVSNLAVTEYLSTYCSTIFIDLPDYTKTDKRLMGKHLSEVQGLWEKVGADKNIVISIQKEIFSGHFFFGKMDVVELTPLKPEELMLVFKTQFKDCDLITDDALLLLGRLSRGVFRRFLKYLKLTCERFVISDEKPPIGVTQVNNAVTVEQLTKDMELELGEVFKDVGQRRQAVELLNQLRENTMNQKEIAEFLNVSEMTAGKVVNKLLSYRYIDRQRGEGREWIIRLKSCS